MRMQFGTILMVSLFVPGFAGLASAKTKSPVAGTWSCVAHGTGEGDMQYTFNLEQTGEQVTGNFTAPTPDGTNQNHDVKNGSFKNGKLELHFEEEEGTIDVAGAPDGKAAMKGDWTQGEHSGTWECKRGAASSSSK